MPNKQELIKNFRQLVTGTGADKALFEVFTAYESEWLNMMVSSKDTDSIRQYQGRVKALRELRSQLYPDPVRNIY